MPTVLITGANRGLGLEFARQYREDGWEVVATARHSSPELDDLGIRVEQLAMEDFKAVAEFGSRLAGLDLLIANAGIYGVRTVTSPTEATEWTETFTVNTIAPFLLAQSVLPQVTRSRGKLIAISSRMGSIADNDFGGFIGYRSSKAALNAAWRSMALDVRDHGVIAAVLHPGWVQTRMGGASAPMDPADSIAGMRQVIAGLGPKQSGGFFAYDGSIIPW